ncbi:MAG: phosphate regulon transcriptional regulator PhoB [OCS116 cluster bacterium]|uniref:Phosphate regulon transcriptional regulatory protein PhoB n=1 Tax=OCS116 cluster bacterium TaxID=2030921 RepID=A0A2A4YWZ0_9PROT|nr:phosphate regulon transcriptional regulator PhoB [OCS116 cluster bacterium]
MKASILIVEDEDSLGILLTYNLENEGYEVRLCTHGDQVDLFIDEKLPDLILLDWMLPGISGVEICRRLRLRSQTRNIPIIMATARGEEQEKLRGFDVGADDYLVKPFAMKELMARVKAVLKRSAPDQMSDKLVSGDITLDASTRRVTRNISDDKSDLNGDSVEVDLGPTEFKLLQYLMQRKGRVFSREQLLDNVWGHDVYVDERTVDVHIGRLRKALKGKQGFSDPIRTIRGAGYSFNDKF